MKTLLSKNLKRYYKRRKGRLVFVNGDSLNELALKIWEKLEFREIDASALSRVINGKRLFTPRQLHAFCRILGLAPKDERFLRESLAKDILSRSGLELKTQNLSAYRGKVLELTLQNSNRLVESVRIMRTRGLPQQAIETATFLEQIAQILKTQYPSDWPKHEETFTRLYNERARAWGEIASPAKILSLMIPDIDRALTTGRKTKNKQLLSMAHMNMGGAYYVSNNWLESAQYLKEALDNVDEDTQLEFYRTMSLDYAFLGNLEKFQKVRKKALKHISEEKYSDLFNAVSLLESIGRGFAILGLNEESLSTLDQAEKLYHKAKEKYGERPFFESQIVRGKLFSLAKNPKIDEDRIISLAKRGLRPKFKAYKRHRKQISQLLKGVKISKYEVETD